MVTADASGGPGVVEPLLHRCLHAGHPERDPAARQLVAEVSERVEPGGVDVRDASASKTSACGCGDGAARSASRTRALT